MGLFVCFFTKQAVNALVCFSLEKQSSLKEYNHPKTIHLFDFTYFPFQQSLFFEFWASMGIISAGLDSGFAAVEAVITCGQYNVHFF